MGFCNRHFAIDYDALASLKARGFRPGGTAQAPRADGEAPDPSGVVSLTDAIQKQLGLKLEIHKRPEPVLVIDHVEEQLTEN